MPKEVNGISERHWHIQGLLPWIWLLGERQVKVMPSGIGSLGYWIAVFILKNMIISTLWKLSHQSYLTCTWE